MGDKFTFLVCNEPCNPHKEHRSQGEIEKSRRKPDIDRKCSKGEQQDHADEGHQPDHQAAQHQISECQRQECRNSKSDAQQPDDGAHRQCHRKAKQDDSQHPDTPVRALQRDHQAVRNGEYAGDAHRCTS